MISTIGSVAVVAQLIYQVFVIIANWKIFEKAGEAGWKTLIPIYNMYIQYKICWSGTMGIAYAVLVIVGECIKRYFTGGLSLLGGFIAMPGYIIGLIGCYKLSKAFGHGSGFTAGLIFLNPIFMMILGFGSSEYVGKEEQTIE